jgi:hypothetical protein
MTGHSFKPDSSAIEHVEWSDNALRITFKNGGIYSYSGVPLEQFHSLTNAPSVGQYYSKNINGKFAHKKVSK